MDKVSIVIPVYNTDCILLENCILSALNQKRRDIELLLIDDGSDNEDTVRLCYKYEEQFDCIKLLRQKNQGPSAARGLGIQSATGKYIMFLDSDDCLMADAADYLANIMEKEKCDLIEAAVREVTVNIQEAETCDKEKFEYYTGREKLLELMVEGCGTPLTWSLWGKMYRTDIIKEHYRIYSDINRGEDLLSLAEYLVQSKTYIYSGRCVYYYNKGNAMSVTSRTEHECNLSLCLVWEKVAELCRLYSFKETYRKAEANYCGTVFGAYLQCLDIESEKNKKVYLRNKLIENKWKYLFNRYISSRGKCIIALICPQLFIMIRKKKTILDRSK